MGHLQVAAEWFGQQLLSDVTPADIREFLAYVINDRECAPSTANRYRISLSVAFQEAIARNLATENPIAQVRPLREEQRPVPYLTAQDIARLLNAAGDRYHDIVLVAVEAGLRRGELLRLRWRDVDWTAGSNGSILVRHAKSKRPRHVPLAARSAEVLRAALAAQAVQPGSEYVFAEHRDDGGNRLTKTFPRIAKRAGFEGLRFHDLRHAFASGLARAAVPIPVIASLLGHATSSLVVTMRYAAHAPNGAEFIAVTQLDSLRRRETSGGAPSAS
jgi:integrase